MDEITLPIRYDNLSIEGVKLHLRYIATLSSSGHCAEILLHNSKVIIPIVKRVYKTKSDQLNLLLRSGSISRDNLAELKSTFMRQHYVLVTSYTAKKKLIRRLSLSISIDDPMLPIICVNILKEVALKLDSRWPDSFSVGYAFGDERSSLPGNFKYRDLIAQAGYKIGYVAGRAKKLILP